MGLSLLPKKTHQRAADMPLPDWRQDEAVIRVNARIAQLRDGEIVRLERDCTAADAALELALAVQEDAEIQHLAEVLSDADFEKVQARTQAARVVAAKATVSRNEAKAMLGRAAKLLQVTAHPARERSRDALQAAYRAAVVEMDAALTAASEAIARAEMIFDMATEQFDYSFPDGVQRTDFIEFPARAGLRHMHRWPDLRLHDKESWEKSRLMLWKDECREFGFID